MFGTDCRRTDGFFTSAGRRCVKYFPIVRRELAHPRHLMMTSVRSICYIDGCRWRRGRRRMAWNDGAPKQSRRIHTKRLPETKVQSSNESANFCRTVGSFPALITKHEALKKRFALFP